MSDAKAETDRIDDKKSEEVPSSDKKSNAPKNKSEIIFNEDITIYPNEPIAEYNKDVVKAFRAQGRNKVATDLFVMVCDKSLTPRHLTAIRYTKIVNSGLCKLVDMGTVKWPVGNKIEEKYCYIYEHSFGPPIWKDRSISPSMGWKTEEVLLNIVVPMINLLQNMRDKDLVHGEIWPGNIYFQSRVQDKTHTSKAIKLGECLSTPCSSQLPALYEPIERALSNSLGRGQGTFTDDLYSFGVTLAVLLRTNDPMKDMSEEQVIEQKIEKGSYVCLLGKDRLNGGILELLRGLLYDDAEQRWTIDDVKAWLDGRRLTPKQSPKRVKAGRPLKFNGRKYIRPELLAKDMWLNTDEVGQIVDNGDLAQWVERSVEDKVLQSKVLDLIEEMGGSDRGGGFYDRLAVRLSTTLYEECPVRFRKLSFIPSGFSKMLTQAFVQKESMQPYADILKGNFIIPIIRNRKRGADTQPLINKFDSSRTIIVQSDMNKGLERCIYLLDNECPCLSEIVSDYYIIGADDLISAFEDICISKPDKKKSLVLFDRHTVSFLSVKDKKNIDPYLKDINSKEPFKRVLGQLRTLATIQKRSAVGPLPALSDWMSDNLDPLYERFNDSKKRDELKKKINKIKVEGDLLKIAQLFDNPDLYQSDVSLFQQAQIEYKELGKEKEKLEKKLEDRTYGQRTGQQVASVLAVFLSFLFVIVTTYILIIQG